MIIIDAILYLTSNVVQYWILQHFLSLYCSIDVLLKLSDENMKYDIFYNFCLGEIWYFCHLRKTIKICLRWAFLQKRCFSCTERVAKTKKRKDNVFIKLCFCDSKKEVSGIWGDTLRTKIPLQGETPLVNILF